MMEVALNAFLIDLKGIHASSVSRSFHAQFYKYTLIYLLKYHKLRKIRMSIENDSGRDCGLNRRRMNMLFDADLMAGDNAAFLKHKGVFRHAAVLKSNKYPSISHPILGGEYGLEL